MTEEVRASADGLIVQRHSGRTQQNHVLSGARDTHARRSAWPQIRDFFPSACGVNLPGLCALFPLAALTTKASPAMELPFSTFALVTGMQLRRLRSPQFLRSHNKPPAMPHRWQSTAVLRARKYQLAPVWSPSNCVGLRRRNNRVAYPQRRWLEVAYCSAMTVVDPGATLTAKSVRAAKTRFLQTLAQPAVPFQADIYAFWSAYHCKAFGERWGKAVWAGPVWLATGYAYSLGRRVVRRPLQQLCHQPPGLLGRSWRTRVASGWRGVSLSERERISGSGRDFSDSGLGGIGWQRW